MNDDNQKIEIDELISLYLDGEASERQQTELKRLVQRDPSILERLKALKKQQQVLNALPVETAPVTLADDIRARMERTLILAETPGQASSVLASGHLAVRRLAATAAMILLPLGLLTLVVFQIMKPADGPGNYVSTDHVVQNDTTAQVPAAPVAAADELPFKGTLILDTDDYMAVNEHVKQAIEEKGLLARTFPDRTADRMRFNITASPDQVAGLIDALAAVRPQCRSVMLQLPAEPDSGDSPIEIPAVEDKQLKMLVYEDNPQMFSRLATRYAAANRKTDPLFEETPDLNPDGYPEPSIPTLAGTYNTSDRTVRLTILVERAD